MSRLDVLSIHEHIAVLRVHAPDGLKYCLAIEFCTAIEPSQFPMLMQQFASSRNVGGTPPPPESSCPGPFSGWEMVQGLATDIPERRAMPS
jgi:hypothetical protein